MNRVHGTVLCITIAAAATVLGRAVPLVGAPVFALVFGILIATISTPSIHLRDGIAFCAKTVLQVAIVVLGLTISIEHVRRTGGQSLFPVMFGSLVATLAVAPIAGRLLGIERTLRTLVGIGTAICGASAIAAVAPVLESSQSEISYAIATVFFYNLVAVLVFPALGHAMHLDARAFGLWAGTAINDTSSVVAAGFAYGPAAAAEAIIVKLTRTTLIVPIVVLLVARRMLANRGSGVHWTRIVPWFILWFVVAAMLNSLHAVPASAQPYISSTGVFLIATALAGVGLSAKFAEMFATGMRPLLLGLILWIVIAASSLALAHYT